MPANRFQLVYELRTQLRLAVLDLRHASRLLRAHGNQDTADQLSLRADACELAAIKAETTVESETHAS